MTDGFMNMTDGFMKKYRVDIIYHSSCGKCKNNITGFNSKGCFKCDKYYCDGCFGRLDNTCITCWDSGRTTRIFRNIKRYFISILYSLIIGGFISYGLLIGVACIKYILSP